MKELLLKFCENKELSRDESYRLMLDITEGRFDPTQVGALLYGMQVCGVTVDEMLGFRDALLQTAVPVELAGLDPVDIVGTGGDGKNTFNISTCAAFVVAGAGEYVCKHGNFSSTSVSGASNVLEACGARFTSDVAMLKHSIEYSGVGYLHAPLYASGMKNVVSVRKALNVPTLFNLLGPLINPSRPAKSLHGVATQGQLRLYTSIHQAIGDKYGIVYSYDGYDEVSLTGPFKFVTDTREAVYTAQSLGFQSIEPCEIYGGQTVDEAKKIFLSVLDGTSTGAQRQVVVANAALALSICRPEASVADCIASAEESLGSGAAMTALRKFIDTNS